MVTRIGANSAVPIDIRLICATNMPIYDMVLENRFRQDLLYRVNTVEIRIPPLRDRLDDMPLLVNHFLRMFSRKYGKDIRGVQPGTLRKLQKYSWPGNIRELQHTVERAIIMTDSSMLRPDDFLLTSSHTKKRGLVLDSFNLTEVEKEVISRALNKHAGNVSRAAEELGLTRASLYRRMQKHDL
jgi:transcriptional regulator with PAS, ATPase and Fis domain